MPPDSAAGLFGQRLGLARHYADWLTGPGENRGLIGPREVPRIWTRHILNCAVVAEAVPFDSTVADVGTGAGLPGLVWAIVRPDLQVTLIEPLLRRTRFLGEVVMSLELDNVAVVRGRAEDMPTSTEVDVVTARAVAPMSKLAGWTLPLLRPGGTLLALKGESIEEELRAAAPQLTKQGAVSWTVEEYGAGVVEPATRVAVVELG